MTGERASIVFITHAMTTTQHEARFPRPTDELSTTGINQCTRHTPPTPDRLLLSPARAATQTAEAFGWTHGHTEPLIGEQDYGHWAGLTIDEIPAPQLLHWRHGGAPPHGEHLDDLINRVATFITTTPPGRTTAITHQSILRAAVITTLNTDPAAFWSIEAEPLTHLAIRRSPTGHHTLHLTTPWG